MILVRYNWSLLGVVTIPSIRVIAYTHDDMVGYALKLVCTADGYIMEEMVTAYTKSSNVYILNIVYLLMNDIGLIYWLSAYQPLFLNVGITFALADIAL